jgi:hypothetical protein
MSDGRVTLEEIDLAIKTFAYIIRRHNLPGALPTLKRLQVYREQRLAEGDALEYADRVLAQYTKTIGATANDNETPKLLDATKAA